MPKDCPKCGGTGVVIDPKEVGAEMRELRRKRGLKQFEVALRMGFTPPYLSDLECGKREWNNSLVKRFKLAVKSNGESRK